MNETEDRDWVRECVSGHPEAFASLVRKYQRMIYNTMVRMMHDPTEAEDLTQTVFVKAYENLGRYDPCYKFFSWIYRMAVNECLNTLQRKKRSVGFDPLLAIEEKSPETLLDERMLRQDIRKALMELEPNQRVLVELKHFQDFSYKEIAFIVGLSEKKVKSRLFSARVQLRDILVREGVVGHAG
jgi:RNA polymerase sigma-70 factor (ECF subfamily)